MRRIEIWLIAVVVLVAAVWGLAWWLIAAYVEGAVDEAIAASAEGDVAIACEERRQRGFPFRFEVVCSGATARDSDGAWSARLERLRAGALVRSPRNIEATLDGPLTVDAVALESPATASWASGRGELVMGEDGPRRLQLRLFSATAEVAGMTLGAHRAQVEVAPQEAGGSRLTGEAEQLRLESGGQALPPLDIAAEALTPIPAEALLAGDIDRSEGISLSEFVLSLEAGQVQAFAEGALDIGAEGRASGSVTLHLVGADRLPALIEALPEGARGAANVAVGAVMALATPAEWRGQPARRIVLTIEDGEVRAGPLGLGRLPPLWEPPPAS